MINSYGDITKTEFENKPDAEHLARVECERQMRVNYPTGDISELINKYWKYCRM